VELGLTQDSRWRAATPTIVDAAKAAGYAALGMYSGGCDADARALFDEAGLRCHELLGLQIMRDPDATVALAERLARDAVTIGAEWVNTTFNTPLNTKTRDTVARCGAILAAAGVGVAVEFSPLGPCPSIEAGLEATAATQVDRAGIIVDIWNFTRGPDTWDDLAQVPLDKVAYLQFNDALAPLSEKPDMEEAMTRRVVPGEGVFECERFASAFRDRGWDGMVSMQVLSDELRKRSYAEYARLVYEGGARYWL
jgi:sugar phosphate isomerase/epimerase